MLKNLYLTVVALSLCCDINATTPPYPAATSNQQLVANQLQTITNPTKNEAILLERIAPLNAQETQKVLTSLSGEPYSTLFVSTEIINRQFIRHLYDPLRPIISNPCSCEDEVYDMCSAHGIKAWAEGTVNRSFLDGNKNAPGFKMSGYELSGGGYKRLDSCWTAGFGFCYAIDHFHYNAGGDGKTNTVLGAVYALYRPKYFYALIDLIFGYGTNDMHRRVQLKPLLETSGPNIGKPQPEGRGLPITMMAHSRPNIGQIACYGETGFDLDCSCILIQPFVGFEAWQFKRDCKREHSTAPISLIYSGKNVTAAYTRLGLHATLPENCYDLIFAFDFAWQYRLTSANNDLKVRFTDFGSAFVLTGAPIERNSVWASCMATSEIFDGWFLYLQGSGERWKRVSNYNLTLGLLFNW
jgi:uncharacterized protein with beta-barrel porin domain